MVDLADLIDRMDYNADRPGEALLANVNRGVFGLWSAAIDHQPWAALMELPARWPARDVVHRGTGHTRIVTIRMPYVNIYTRHS
jgi:hypothetical protein